MVLIVPAVIDSVHTQRSRPYVPSVAWTAAGFTTHIGGGVGPHGARLFALLSASFLLGKCQLSSKEQGDKTLEKDCCKSAALLRSVKRSNGLAALQEAASW